MAKLTDVGKALKSAKMVLGTILDCLQYHHKVMKTSRMILDLSDVTIVHEPMRS